MKNETRKEITYIFFLTKGISQKICILCVGVKINKCSFESFCVWIFFSFLYIFIYFLYLAKTLGVRRDMQLRTDTLIHRVRRLHVWPGFFFFFFFFGGGGGLSPTYMDIHTQFSEDFSPFPEGGCC